MAFRKKATFILTQKPDILIIVECEHPDKLLYTDETPKPTDYLWFGKNGIKALQYFHIAAIVLKFLKTIMRTLK